MHWTQLGALEIDHTTVKRWRKHGYLHRVLPRVYAVGHCAPSVEADLAAALLYAGPGAMVSHATAAWWLGLRDERPPTIHVTTLRRCRSLPGITVHQRRQRERVWREGLPSTSVAEAIVDCAVTSPLNQVRRDLANAEYRKLLDLEAIEAALGQGRPGSAKVRKALKRHQPRLAHALSPVEQVFIELCEPAAIPMPDVNVRIAGWKVDFLWRRERVVVEVDPSGNHHTPAQVDRDRRKDMALRQAGLIVNRYSRPQLEDTGAAVIADVIATLAGRATGDASLTRTAPSSGRGSR